jgi:hypothetical protein
MPSYHCLDRPGHPRPVQQYDALDSTNRIRTISHPQRGFGAVEELWSAWRARVMRSSARSCCCARGQRGY